MYLLNNIQTGLGLNKMCTIDNKEFSLDSLMLSNIEAVNVFLKALKIAKQSSGR